MVPVIVFAIVLTGILFGFLQFLTMFSDAPHDAPTQELQRPKWLVVLVDVLILPASVAFVCGFTWLLSDSFDR